MYSMDHVSLLQLYKIETFINTGYKVGMSLTKVPIRSKKYLLEVFPLEYSRKYRCYTCTFEEAYEKMKELHSNYINQNNIQSYAQLYFMATNIQ